MAVRNVVVNLKTKVLCVGKTNQNEYGTNRIWLMARLHIYKCNNCGWTINAPKDGNGIVMFGNRISFVCHDCKHIFDKFYAFGATSDVIETCLQYKSSNTSKWAPSDGCPLCGGKVEDKGQTLHLID